MLRSGLSRVFLILLFSTPLLFAECAQDRRSEKTGGILVTDFAITGTTAIASAELARMTSDFIGSCFNDDADEISERLRAAFQDRGYFTAEIKHVEFKPGDPLGNPKPITVEAVVAEGPIYTLAGITFSDNHAISSQSLRDQFPMKKGAIFERGRVAAGLESLRKLYGTHGFLDVTPIPETDPSSNGTVTLKISLDEGTQYHMGRIEVLAEKETAARLRNEWKLQEGTVYDSTYLDKYIEANRDLLPAGFTRNSVQAVSDCPHAVVDIKLIVDKEQNSPQPTPPDIPCEEKHDNPK